MIRGILFDKDGTLFDYQKSWAAVNLEAGALAGGADLELTRELLKIGGADPQTGHAVADSLMAAGNAAEIAARWVKAGSPLLVEALTAKLDRLFLDAAHRMVPVTDLASFFGRLKRVGLKLGVASSDSESAVWAAAQHFGFADHLDFVAGYDSGHGHKPTEGMPLAFCRTQNLLPEHIAVVGDNLHDLEMGRRAGAGLKIGVLTGSGTRETLTPHADHVLDSIDQIWSLIDLPSSV